MSTAGDNQEILHNVENHVGIATLNRPKALNTLNTNMVKQLLKVYTEWEASPEVSCIILKGAGDKAFCAGGDVKTVALWAKDGEVELASQFFKTEYEVDHLIHTLRKPHVALIDGITFGGGVGVSVHGTFAVATEKTLFAMPECAIGLYPDVGGSYFLPRLPGGLGLYLALSGARLTGVDVLKAKVATHYIPSSALPELETALKGLGVSANVGSVRQLLDDFQARTPLPEGHLVGQRQDIDSVFLNPGSVEAVHEALHQHPNQPWATKILDQINKGSPLSQKLTFEQLKRGKAAPDLATCLCMENRMVLNVLNDPKSDFVEGVRALLIDRDNQPAWNPPSLAQVDDAAVQSHFKLPLGRSELFLATASRAKL